MADKITVIPGASIPGDGRGKACPPSIILGGIVPLSENLKKFPPKMYSK